MTISQTFEIMVTFLKLFIRLLSQILVLDAPGITEKDENRSTSTTYKGELIFIVILPGISASPSLFQCPLDVRVQLVVHEDAV